MSTSSTSTTAPVVQAAQSFPPSSMTAASGSNDSGTRKSSVRQPRQIQPAEQHKTVPLLPNPLVTCLVPTRNRRSRQRSSLTKATRLCSVPFCHFKNCTLESHRQPFWTRGSQSSIETQSSSASADPSNENGKSLSLDDPGLCNLTSRALVIYQEIDGLPSLPIENCEVPRFRSLFYEFFNHHYARLVRVAFPPPFSFAGKQALDTVRRRAVEVALSEPVFCMSRIVQAHHEIMCQADYRCMKPFAIAAHTKLLELLRAKLDNVTAADVADLVPVIYQVSLLDAAAGRIGAIRNHRKLIKHLIDSCGGIYNVPRIMSVVQSLDRLISIALDLPPLYLPPPNNLIRRPRFVPLLYGSYLDSESSRELLGRGIHQYCLDSCNAIEILECEGWSFNPDDPPFHNSPNIHYFFYIRDCLAYDFAQLSIATAHDKTIARCVLLISKIVDYLATFDNYVLILPILIAQKFQAIVDDPECTIDWQQHQPILIWSLFVLATLTESWSGHFWAISLLRQQLDLRYGVDCWPEEWRQYELNNLRCFVWSDSRMCIRFKTICDEIQSVAPGVYD